MESLFGETTIDPATKKQLSQVTDTIFTLRAERDWSQKTLAKKAKICYTTIAKVELENHYYSLHSLLKLCKAFDISMSQLFDKANL